MTRTALVATATAIAMLSPPAAADPIIDASVVRSIERISPMSSRLTAEAERPLVQQYLASALTGMFRGAQISQVTLGGQPGTATVTISVRFVFEKQQGQLKLRLSGTMTGHVTISVAAGNVVDGRLYADAIAFDGNPAQSLNGIELPGTSMHVTLPGIEGTIRRITLASLDPGWIAFSIDVEEGP